MTFSKRHNCGNSEKISAFGSLGRGGAQMEHGGCGGSETALRSGGHVSLHLRPKPQKVQCQE